MTDTTTQSPDSPDAKPRNWFSRLSVVCGIIGFFTVGSARTMGQLMVTGILGGIIGILAIILGIVGLKQSSRLNHGRFASIIGIIGGLLAALNIAQPILIPMRENARIERVRSDFRSLSGMLEQYNRESGFYPTTSQGLDSLVERPSGSPYSRNWKQLTKVLPKDPWQNEYFYRFPGSRDKHTFEILSKGPDGEKDTPDDISSQDLTP